SISTHLQRLRDLFQHGVTGHKTGAIVTRSEVITIVKTLNQIISDMNLLNQKFINFIITGPSQQKQEFLN
ncbi:hypothetical protein ACJMK2_006868, partial [Sinanodonta woodiana]